MRRLKENAIFIFSFIITVMVMLVIENLLHNIVSSYLIGLSVFGLSLLVFSSIRFGGRK